MNQKIRILLYGSNLWALGAGMLGPLFAIFAERLGGNILEISWAWATYLMISGFFVIIVGKMTEKKYSKSRVMMLGYWLNALFTFGYLIVSEPWHLFVVQSGLGIALAMASPTWSALYAKYEDKKHDTFEWGLADGEARIITGIAMVIGGLIVSYLSFTALFATMGIIQSIAAIYQSKILVKK
jgi:hypothetical protein